MDKSFKKPNIFTNRQEREGYIRAKYGEPNPKNNTWIVEPKFKKEFNANKSPCPPVFDDKTGANEVATPTTNTANSKFMHFYFFFCFFFFLFSICSKLLLFDFVFICVV